MKKEHKTELRTIETKGSFCIQPGCKFKGQRAAQGVCFSTLDHTTDKYVDGVMKAGEDFLKEMKALRRANDAQTDKKWIRYLEGNIVCAWANWTFGLDELVQLRAENAKLRLQLGKWPRK